MDQWLNACVAIERVMTVIKGTAFVKKKSKQAAKFTIIILLIVIIGTCVHDPIYRQLIDEENDDDEEDRQKRTWCIIRYSSNFEVYNDIINIFHFVGPFLINLISSIILIIKQSRQQSTVHRQRSYKEHLREQCRQHQNLLTAPVLLVILTIPRLIITFLSKCMQSANDSWLFLVGYFISFIPPMLTFLIFISPSKFYRKELRKTIDNYRTYIQQRLPLSS
jgi:hypothetical protein